MSFFYEEREGVLLLRCRELLEAGAAHAFSTRIGGVSKGPFESLNLGLSRGDAPEAVEENYRRFLSAAGVQAPVCRVRQVHGAVVHEAPEQNARPEPGVSPLFGGLAPRDGDGLMTDRVGVPLRVYYADCMPVLLCDPVRRVCAAVHSGWRGTVLCIAAEAVRRMGERYGSAPGDILAAIGPSAGPLRYEVSEEVAAQFEAAFGAASGVVLRRAEEARGRYEGLSGAGEFVRPHVDLWRAAQRALADAGVPEGQILISGICTVSEPERYFSHRVMGDRRGNGAAVIALEEERG